MNVLITGHSSGIGAGLTKVLLAAGNHVLGLSKSRGAETHPNLYQENVDLQNESEVSSALSRLVYEKLKKPDLIFLNAGVLGPIASLQDTKSEELQYVMRINVWANKVILDWFLNHKLSPAQIITISSGAAIRGNFGWSSYALSKSTLNMLTQLYAHEFKNSHLLALAPGYVDTKMQSVLRTKSSSTRGTASGARYCPHAIPRNYSLQNNQQLGGVQKIKKWVLFRSKDYQILRLN